MLKFTFSEFTFFQSALSTSTLHNYLLYIPKNCTQQTPENRRELVASSWVTYTVCVGSGSNNNRDSKSQRAEFFHWRKNESHSYSKHSKPCGALLMEKWVSLLLLCFISLCITVRKWGAKKNPLILKYLHRKKKTSLICCSIVCETVLKISQWGDIHQPNGWLRCIYHTTTTYSVWFPVRGTSVAYLPLFPV